MYSASMLPLDVKFTNLKAMGSSLLTSGKYDPLTMFSTYLQLMNLCIGPVRKLYFYVCSYYTMEVTVSFCIQHFSLYHF